MGGDKYHQLGFVESGGLGAKQLSYIGEVLQNRNARDRVCGVRLHQSTHNQNLVVFQNHFGIDQPGVKRRLVSYICTTAGDFLADFQGDLVI